VDVAVVLVVVAKNQKLKDVADSFQPL